MTSSRSSFSSVDAGTPGTREFKVARFRAILDDDNFYELRRFLNDNPDFDADWDAVARLVSLEPIPVTLVAFLKTHNKVKRDKVVDLLIERAEFVPSNSSFIHSAAYVVAEFALSHRVEEVANIASMSLSDSQLASRLIQRMISRNQSMMSPEAIARIESGVTF